MEPLRYKMTKWQRLVITAIPFVLNNPVLWRTSVDHPAVRCRFRAVHPGPNVWFLDPGANPPRSCAIEKCRILKSREVTKKESPFKK